MQRDGANRQLIINNEWRVRRKKVMFWESDRVGGIKQKEQQTNVNYGMSS